MVRRIAAFDDVKCYGCGACVEICPFGAIVLTAGKPKVRPELCDGGGDCLYRCPAGAAGFAMTEAPPFDRQAAAAQEARLGRPVNPDRECGEENN